MHQARLSFFLISLLSLSLIGGCGKALGDQRNLPRAGHITITGTVTDPTGQPLPWVLVTPEPIGQTSGPIPEIAIYTDKDGHFRWTVPSGPYDFVFQKEGYHTHRERVYAQPGKPITPLTVQLQPS